MICPQCRRRRQMIAWRRQEEEDLEIMTIVKAISSRQCPACGLVITVVVPMTFEREQQ